MKRSAVGGSGVSPDYKSARGESNMADSSFYQESIECIQEESETPPTEPNLKDIHNILKSIQGAISVMQSTIAKLVKENNKLSRWRSRPSAHYRKEQRWSRKTQEGFH